MKSWLRSGRGMRWLSLAGLMTALALAVSRGQAVPQEAPGYGEQYPAMAQAPSPAEPPMVDAPLPPPSPVSPLPRFTPPSPTPLPPEQAVPFVPGMPPLNPSPFGGAIQGMVGPLDLPAPLVRLRLHAPARIEPDKEIEYRITVENVSSAEAHHVLVRDRLPRGIDVFVRAEPSCEKKSTKDGLTDLLWDMGTLKAGDHKTIVLVIKSKGTEDVENRAFVQFEHGQKVTTHMTKPGETPALRRAEVPDAKPSARVRVTAPPQAILYQEVPFQIEIANTGSVPLRNVVVTDELPAGLEFVKGKPEPGADKPLKWKLGDVPPNQTRRIEYQAISNAKAGTFRDKVKVTAEGGVNESAGAAVAVGETKLKISISGPQRRLANRPIPYHITVANLGTVPLTNVKVEDELPPGVVEFQSADSGGQQQGGFVRWSLGTLAPNQLRSMVLILRCPQPGSCWNEVTVRADNNLSAKARSDRTHIDESATSPAIEIDRNADRLVVGQKVTYTIRLFNPGKSIVQNASVLVAVPEEMSIRGQRGPTSGKQEGQQIRFDRLPVLNAGKEDTYVVEVEAKKGGEAHLRAWWTVGSSGTSPMETWEDKAIILDPARTASGVASAPR